MQIFKYFNSLWGSYSMILTIRLARALRNARIYFTLPGILIITCLHGLLSGCTSYATYELQNAVIQNDLPAVQQSLSQGGNPNGKGGTGLTPLMFASLSHAPEREKIIRALLADGADPNKPVTKSGRSQGQTALHIARSAEAVEALLENGADPTLRDKQGRLPADVIEMYIVWRRDAPGLEEAVAQSEAALEILGRKPMSETQAWEQHPQLMEERKQWIAKRVQREKLMQRANEGKPAVATADTSEKTPADTPIIRNNSGRYLSPYTSDGVVAEWVNKAINNQMGSAAGSAVGAAAGNYAAQRALENVPGGALIGSIFGSMAGKTAGNKVADDISGGDAYRRQTSDLSFHSLNDMAAWLRAEHSDKANFAEVTKATNAVYPGLLDAITGL